MILALATQCERLALGWLVLSATDSVFLTAASFAVQKAPGSLVSPLAGYMSDHLSRSKMIAATAIYKAVIVVLLGFLALAFWVLLIFGGEPLHVDRVVTRTLRGMTLADR